LIKKPLFLILLYVFVDVLGFSLILPLLPFYAETFDATPGVVGMLLGANAVTQLIGAPLIGRLSDRYGRRPMLLISVAGTAISFILLGLANSLFMLFFSRILDGFLGGNISLAQAYITDITEGRERSKGLGFIGAAFGLGFIFGPAIGGTLSAGGNYTLPALAAAALALVNLLGVLFILPESLTSQDRKDRVQSSSERVTLSALLRAMKRPCVGPLLNLILFYGLAFTMFQSIFAIFAQQRLALDAQSTGYILTYVGVVIVVVQGGVISLLTKYFADKQLIFAGAVLLAASLLAWAFTYTIWMLLIVLIPIALAGGVLNVVSNSALSKSVRREETGGTLGLSAALGSLDRVVSPVLGGVLIGRLGPWGPGLLGAALMAVMSIFIWNRILFVPDAACPEPESEPDTASSVQVDAGRAY
jgi:DHA1 family tetracycline resistance protein-like MFS transporter